MSMLAALTRDERRQWAVAGSFALAAHLALGVLVLGWGKPAQPPLPEPVVELELPPAMAPAPGVADLPAKDQPLQAAAPVMSNPPLNVPPVNAPLPHEIVAVAQPKAQPVVVQPVAAPMPAPAPAAAAPAVPVPSTRATVAGPVVAPGGDNPNAKRQEVDYRALVNAYLARRKTYPTEAKKARDQGVVAVRFVLDRQGEVSDISLLRGSGHATLDQATLDLVRRIAPYPRMPASLNRNSVTMALAIEYSLRTD